MPGRHTIITRVWIADGCIVCDACANDCPEVFDVRPEGCIIRPTVDEALLARLTPEVQTAAGGCPVEVIKFETREVESIELAAPEQDSPAPSSRAASSVDQLQEEWDELIETSRLGDSGDAWAPEEEPAQVSRRKFSLAVAVGWTAVAAAGALSVPMFQDFMSPKSPSEPRTRWHVGKLEQFLQPMLVNEQFKRTPDGGPGFWLVNLSPRHRRLVAVSVICTHLGCIPDWLSGEGKFKCPCHGSGFSIAGLNLEGPAPRPLERFGISIDSEGFVIVDQSKVYRQEAGQWDSPGSYVAV